MEHPAVTAHKPTPIRKERNVLFAKFPPDQVREASGFLRRVEDLEVEAHDERRSVGVAYDLNDHTLQEIEDQLTDKGFHLDNTLMSKMMRALVHYVEETQLHNLDAPNRLHKRSQHAAYVHAWDRHLHGDHDDTPPEWREYR